MIMVCRYAQFQVFFLNSLKYLNCFSDTDLTSRYMENSSSATKTPLPHQGSEQPAVYLSLL